MTVLLDKIEAFQDDFSDQYFRSHVNWIYYFEDSWLDRFTEKSGGASHLKEALAKRLRRFSKALSDMFKTLPDMFEFLPGKLETLPNKLRTLPNMFQTWRQNVESGWNALTASLPPLGLPKWVKHIEQLALEAFALLLFICIFVPWEIQASFSDSKVIMFLIIIAYACIISFLIETILRNIGAFMLRNAHLRQKLRNRHRRQTRRRALNEDTMNFYQDGNHNRPTFCSSVSEEDNLERIQSQACPHPSKSGVVTTRLDEMPFGYRPVTSRANISRRSNESEVSFNMAKTSQGPTSKEIDIGSVNGQGPVPRTKVTDSIRVGGRRIHMIYGTRDEGLADDSEEEIVAVVSQSSTKENNLKLPGKPLPKNHPTKTGDQSDRGDSDMMRSRVTQRKTRQSSDEGKRRLVDASNTSHATEDTRVLRSRTSSVTTKSTDLHLKVDAKKKSKIPRRRSARLSAAHMNDDVG
ncbi:hypothetical protein FGB62_4g121 [Gracilaria domingensis]|nr:hypothetical protein FGB62_4g121 [Gracilaria domingensis]